MLNRVVWGLGEVIETFWPKMLLSNVDFPALGRPIKQTIPAFIGSYCTILAYSMQKTSDEALVRQIQEGSILAFEILVKRYQTGLSHFVYRIVFDEKTAEEVVQDSFFSVYKSVDRIDTHRKFSTYLFTIAKNQAISALRSLKKTVSLEEETAIETDESIYEKLSAQERHDGIKTALGQISQHNRQIIELYYFADLSYEEIARKVKLPINTVRTRLRRGKAELQKILRYEAD
jgi:RNA polymerase sigma-70 factor (ECF subfamily)